MTIPHLRHHTSYGTQTKGHSVARTLKLGALRTLTALGTVTAFASTMLPLAQASPPVPSPAPAPDEQPHASLRTTVIFLGAVAGLFAGIGLLKPCWDKIKYNDDDKDDIDIEAQAEAREKARAHWENKYNNIDEKLSKQQFRNNILQKMGLTLGALGGASMLGGIILAFFAPLDDVHSSFNTSLGVSVLAGGGAMSSGYLAYLCGAKNEKDPLLLSIEKDLENPDFIQKLQDVQRHIGIMRPNIDKIQKLEKQIEENKKSLGQLEQELLKITSSDIYNQGIFNRDRDYVGEFDKKVNSYIQSLKRYKAFIKNNGDLSSSEGQAISKELQQNFQNLNIYIETFLQPKEAPRNIEKGETSKDNSKIQEGNSSDDEDGEIKPLLRKEK